MRLLAAALGLNMACAAAAAGVEHPLDRPALATRHATRSLLLDVTLAGPRVVAVGERGIIVLSDDGGTSWRQARVPVTVSLTKVAFVNERRGWAVGHYGVVLHSADGGESWQRQLDSRMAASLGVAESADKPFLDLYFADERNGFVVGAYNLAFRTRDGGRTWEHWSDRIDNPQSLHLYVVGRSGNSLYVAGEQGLFLRSTDGGDTFVRVPTPGKASWFAAVGAASGAIVLAGLRGHAIRTGDGGTTWTALRTQERASFVAAASDGARIVLVDQAGHVLTADGATLQRLRAAPIRGPTGIAIGLGGALFVSGAEGVTRIVAVP